MENLCEKYSELISAFVDGELSPEESAELKQHLDACPDCRAYLKTLQDIHAASPELLVDVPEGLSTRVMTSIKLNKNAEKRFALSRFKFTAIAAAIVLLVLAAGKLESFAPWLAQSDSNDAAAPESIVTEGAEEDELVPATLSPLNDTAEVQQPAPELEKARVSAPTEQPQASARAKNAVNAPAAKPKQQSAAAKKPAEPEIKKEASGNQAAPEPQVQQEQPAPAQPIELPVADAESALDSGASEDAITSAPSADTESMASGGGGLTSDGNAATEDLTAGAGAASGGAAALPEQNTDLSEQIPLPDASVEESVEESVSDDTASNETDSSPEQAPSMPAIPQTEAYAFCIVVEDSKAISLFAEYPSKIFEGNYIISFDKADKSKVLSKLKESDVLYYEYAGDAQAPTAIIVIVSR